MLRIVGMPVYDDVCNLGVPVYRDEEVENLTLVAVDATTKETLCKIAPKSYEEVLKFVIVYFVKNVDIFFFATEEYDDEEEHLYKMFRLDYEN